MWLKLKRLLIAVLVTSVAGLGVMQPAQAAMINTAQVQGATSGEQDRTRIVATLNRPEVQARLQELGVAPADAQARVAALTDAEAASLAERIDSLPAGGEGIISGLIFVFIVLLITDILGFTKVFPFTHAMKR